MMLLVLSLSLIAFSASQTCSEDGFCVENDGVVISKTANAQGTPPKAVKDCVDLHPDCKHFSEYDQCEINPGWMIIYCPQSCNACELRDPKLRCNRDFLNISSEPILKAGSINSIFEKIIDTNGTYGSVTVHSLDPWVVTFDNFMTDDESNAIIEVVDTWERSTDTGTMNEYGVEGRTLSTSRTSSNAWCREDCEALPQVQSVIGKIEQVTQIPYDNYESFQILRYETGQFYRAHHDSAESDNELACGTRILTMFLYLSDVEAGGETAFPMLGLAIKPRKGRAVLWPGVTNLNPAAIDRRTTHEARPVTSGLKYAANSWIHMYNFRQPNKWGCTGAFD